VKRTVVFTAGVLALGLAGYFGNHLRAQAPGGTAPASAEPRTRIALLNLAYVIKNYKKTETFQAEMKDSLKAIDSRIQAKQMQMEQLGKQAADPKTTAEQREGYIRDNTRLKREIEDINAEAKLSLSKKSDEQMVILYREIQDATRRYAMANNFDLVFHYIDATTQADYYLASNIMRKLQSPACQPFYQAPNLDISRDVVIMLNTAWAHTAPSPASNARPSGN
jgi:Skp family chaperone for outer membrane proteins